jgi:hypothetical protein
MSKVRLNISASYEDAGWNTSIVSIADNQINDGWQKKFGDVRGDMNSLNISSAYRIMESAIGTYYSQIIPNRVCTREGKIQITIFIQSGFRVSDEKILLHSLNDITKIFDETQDEELKKFFEKDIDAVEHFKKTADAFLNKIQVETDYELKGRKLFDTQNSKIAYRQFSDASSIAKFFKNPHQDVNSEYKSVYLIDKTACPDDSTINLGDSLQKLYTIINGKDRYYILEGDEFEVPLTSQPQMLPKVLKVIADGKSQNEYSVNGSDIIIDEKKVDFYRDVQIQFNYPENIDNDEKEDIKLKIDGLKSDELTVETIDGQKQYKFCAHKKLYNVSIDSKYFALENSRQQIDPQKKDSYNLSLKQIRRIVKIHFLADEKITNLGEDAIVSCVARSESNSKTNATYSAENNCWSVELKTDVNYELKLEKTTYELSSEKYITTQKRKYEISVKNIKTPVYIKLDDNLRIEDETEKINQNDKKYGKFPIEDSDYLGHNRHRGGMKKIIVVPPIWKKLAIFFMVLSMILLASTLYLAYINISEVNKTLQTKSTTPLDSAEVVNDSAMTDSSAAAKDSIQQKDSLNQKTTDDSDKNSLDSIAK